MPKRPRCKCPDPTAVAILARISDKDRQTQASLEVQLRETKEKLVDPNGWHVATEYSIKHRSAGVLKDHRFAQMLADARAGKFARLCIHKFDRLGRRAYEREVTWHILREECGIEILAALEPYDLDSRAGKLTKKTSEFLADVFLDNLAEETAKGMREKLLAGGWVGKAPYGYINRREEIGHNKSRRWVEPDPASRQAVSLIFDLFATGEYTLTSLAGWLASQGYLWAGGLPWTRSRVYRVLSNPFYVGRMEWRGITADGVHERLTEPDLWERCRQILRQHDDFKDRGPRRPYALVGVLWSDELRCGFHAETQPHADLSYYRSKRTRADGSRLFLRADQVEERVGDVLAGLSIPAPMHPLIRKLYRRHFAEASEPTRSESDRLHGQIASLEAEARGYVRLVAQGKISDQEFDEERARVGGAIAKARAELAVLEGGAERMVSDLDIALSFTGLMAELWERADADRRRLIATVVFRRVVVGSAGEVASYELAPLFAYLAGLKDNIYPPEAGGRGSKNVALGTRRGIRTPDLHLERVMS